MGTCGYVGCWYGWLWFGIGEKGGGPEVGCGVELVVDAEGVIVLGD